MADNNSGGTTFLAFIVGGLIVAVVVIGFFMYNGNHASGPTPANINVSLHAPKMPSPGKPQ